MEAPKNREIRVLSLFDWMSCGQQALEQAGIPVSVYYASEIDKYAIQITQKNYPNTIQLWDVTKWREWNLWEIDMIIGGSPCQDLSIAGKRAWFDWARSWLFWDMVDIIAHYKPKYFLLENVASMSKDNKAIITEAMWVEPILINSALLTAQNRKRLYWTNISWITQPKDKGIVIKDILEDEVDEKYYLNDSLLEKLKYLKGAKKEQRVKDWHEYTYSEWSLKLTKKEKSLPTLASWAGTVGRCATIVQVNDPDHSNNRVYWDNGKSPTLNTMQWWHRQPKIVQKVWDRDKDNWGMREDKSYSLPANPMSDRWQMVMSDRIRKLTPTECERLQWVRDWYTEWVSNSQRYKMIWNWWTVPVISHIFSFIPHQTNDE